MRRRKHRHSWVITDEALTAILREALLAWMLDESAGETPIKHLHDAVRPLISVRADAVREAEALRVAARHFVEDMAGVWGGDSKWLTTGTRVAEVAACVLREMAADLESECEWCGQRDAHANGCRLGLGPDERGPHRGDCNCAPPHADCGHPPCDCTECIRAALDAKDASL